MGQMLPPFVVVMVPTFKGFAVSDINFPAYAIRPEDAKAFKEKWDGTPDNLEYVPMINVMDLRGKFPRALP